MDFLGSKAPAWVFRTKKLQGELFRAKMAWQSASKDLELARSSASEAEQKELRAMKSGVPRGPDGSKHAGFGPTSALFYLILSIFSMFLSVF